MRVRMLALVLGTAALSLGSVAAFADEGGWRHEDRGYRQEYRDDYRPNYWREYRRDRWDERREQCEELRARYERDQARYYHEMREGDWREARELRERLQWTGAALERCGW